jgi:hypothetical protein
MLYLKCFVNIKEIINKMPGDPNNPFDRGITIVVYGLIIVFVILLVAGLISMGIGTILDK